MLLALESKARSKGRSVLQVMEVVLDAPITIRSLQPKLQASAVVAGGCGFYFFPPGDRALHCPSSV